MKASAPPGLDHVVDRQAIINRIRTLVKIKGGPAATAALCGMKLATLETYLRGDSLPGAVALARLALGCGVSSDLILFGPRSRDG